MSADVCQARRREAAPAAWDRQRDEHGELEPGRWFSRWDAYRAMGPERSLMAAYREWRVQRGAEGCRVTSISASWLRNSRKWNWKARAEAWDEHRRQLDYIAEQAAHDEMRGRHRQLGEDLQEIGSKALQRFVALQAAGEPALDPADARLFLKDGIAIERMARGLPVELLALYEMSDEQLQSEYARSNVGATGQRHHLRRDDR